MKQGTVKLLLCVIVGLLLTACMGGKQTGVDNMPKSYTQISQEEAKQMMKLDDGHIVLDVRRQDEYDAGHIPDAVCMPNESIGKKQPASLPDLNQTILIYCRSGNRSKQAAQKLADLGYSNVYEFGGILDWTGEIVTDTSTAAETPKTEEEKPEPIAQPAPILVIKANGRTFYAHFSENSSADALIERLGTGEITVSMHDYGGFEKVGELPWELPRNDLSITTQPGDVILYQGNQITVYYDENTWSFTKLAHIENITGAELLGVFGEGDVDVTLCVEWSE